MGQLLVHAARWVRGWPGGRGALGRESVGVVRWGQSGALDSRSFLPCLIGSRMVRRVDYGIYTDFKLAQYLGPRALLLR
jgi:hypothetical protein